MRFAPPLTLQGWRARGNALAENIVTKPAIFSRSAILGFCCALITYALPAAAQDETARAIVQPLPSAEVQRLNRALLELARRPQSYSALLEAGDASLAVGDLDAAVGFYGRAADSSPTDPRAKIGLGRVYLQSGRPLEAIPLLNDARAKGAPESDVLSDQALAFDLVGDQSSAQTAYARLLELKPQDDEARRRYALSHAISGNVGEFETTLRPLLDSGDNAAKRTRAFGLAILGEQERAEAIVNAVMPRDLAVRINPYLAYMPRLTAAQKAAAANLGIFPRAADIGREDPRIVRFAREGTVGSRLEPAGEPLGSPVETISQEIAQVTPEPSPSVAEAFADIGSSNLPEAGARTNGDAVDLAAIDIPREEEPAPPAEPEHPRRVWVQLATGRDVEALSFDWRRFARRAPDQLERFEPHVTPWGQSNRLLAGPLDSRASARALINALAQKGIDTFSYTSPEGHEIQKLR